MQRINIDNVVHTLSRMEIKNISSEIKTNIKPLVFDKQYFLNLGGSPIKGLTKDKVYKFFHSKSRFMKSLKKLFLKELQKKGILSCVYCGKTSNIHRELSDKLVRLYDIEHFLPRSRYYYLAINLYNWLPVCKACNETLKNNRDPLETTDKNNKIFHPYFGWIYKNGSKIEVDGSIFDKKVTFVGNPDPKYDTREQIFKTPHGKIFKLGKIYLNDYETFNIFEFIYDKYTKIKDEYQRFKQTSKSIEEFVEYFFKNYYPEKEQDILKYSNGKFKKDLIEYMKKILEKEIKKISKK